jgi:phenylacetate-CoA ligase
MVSSRQQHDFLKTGTPMNAVQTRLEGLLGTLLAHDHWSRAELEAHQAERLRALVTHAVAQSPYYRETLGPDAAQRPLHELPTLSKRALMEHFDDVVTDPRLRRADLEAHLAGPSAEESYLGEYRVVLTSGTTGSRGLFVFTEEEAATWLAASVRAGLRAGISPALRPAQIGTPSRVHLTRQVLAHAAGPPGGGRDLSTATPLPELVAALNELQPEVLYGYPSVAAALAEEQLAGRLDIPLRAAALGAEPLRAAARERIRQAWGFEPVSAYAATEAPMIAASTPGHPELELAEDVVIVEPQDDRVLITNLVNFAQPLIRYELTDVATMADGPNPSGRPYRRLAAVDGRSADLLLLPARGGGRTRVHPSTLNAAVARFPAVRQYQFTLRDGTLHTRVVLAPGTDPAALADLGPALQRAIAATGAVPPHVSVEPADTIPRDPSGKYRLVTAT